MIFVLIFVIFFGGHSQVVQSMQCDFMDSINVTNGEINTVDHSITYLNKSYTSDQFGEFNFKIISGSIREKTNPYLRACSCLDKPCIRLTCQPGFDGRNCSNYNGFTNYSVNILNDFDKFENVRIFDNFGYVLDTPCSTFFEEKQWNITKVS